MANIFEGAECGTKYKLKNGDFVFYINRTVVSFTHSAAYLVAYKGHLYEYNSEGKLLHTEPVYVEFLHRIDNLPWTCYSEMQIVEKVQ